jgi:hypothetical protein
MSSENDAIKMLAYSLGRLSTACFFVAFMVPLLGMSTALNVASDYMPVFLMITVVGWLLAGLALHFFGLRVLGGLK